MNTTTIYNTISNCGKVNILPAVTLLPIRMAGKWIVNCGEGNGTDCTKDGTTISGSNSGIRAVMSM